MAEWRAGRSTGRTLWRDEQLVGMVDSPEIAREIVEAMNARGRQVEMLVELAGYPPKSVRVPLPESGRERSPDAIDAPAPGQAITRTEFDRLAEAVGTGRAAAMAVCRCHLCQSGEDRYESRCGICDALITVVRGRVEEHGEEGARCPGSGEDAG